MVKNMLTNKIAIVTGANRGIGAAITRKFAENHCTVYACARNQSEQFEQNIEEISKITGSIIKPVYFDVKDRDAVKNAIKEIGKETKQIDILVNNAGVSVESLLSMTAIDTIEDTLNVNYISQVYMAQLVSRYMMKAKSGSIINIASVAGMDAEEGGVAYGSSKAAVIFATKTMALEFGKYGIRANSISPGFVRTDMWGKRSEELKNKIMDETPLRRQGEPEEIANVALFLASDLSSYMTGQNLVVDGGRKMGGQ